MKINNNLNRYIVSFTLVITLLFAFSYTSFSQKNQKSTPKSKNQETQAQKSTDQDDNMHYNLGVIAAENKNFSDALKEFTAALAINPKNTFALYGKGSVYYQIKQLDSAIVYLNKVLALKPDDELALGLRAASYQQLEKYQQAIADYHKLINHDTTNPHYFLNLAYCYQMSSDTTQAIKYYKIAESKGDTTMELYYNLASIYASKLNFKQSLEYVDKILAKNPDFSEIYDLQLYNIMKIYNCDSAIHRYSAIIDKIEHKARNLLEIGICKLGEKEYPTAIALFTESYKIDSLEILNLYYRGFVYARLDSIDQCIEDLEKFIALSKSQPNYNEFQLSAQKQLDVMLQKKNLGQ